MARRGPVAWEALAAGAGGEGAPEGGGPPGEGAWERFLDVLKASGDWRAALDGSGLGWAAVAAREAADPGFAAAMEGARDAMAGMAELELWRVALKAGEAKALMFLLERRLPGRYGDARERAAARGLEERRAREAEGEPYAHEAFLSPEELLERNGAAATFARLDCVARARLKASGGGGGRA
jgi:hypothetical protein